MIKFKSLVLAGAMFAGSVYAEEAPKPIQPAPSAPASTEADVKAQIAKLVSQLGDGAKDQHRQRIHV